MYNNSQENSIHSTSQLHMHLLMHYLSYEDADESLGTSDEKIYSSQNITEDDRTNISIDIYICICSLDL